MKLDFEDLVRKHLKDNPTTDDYTSMIIRQEIHTFTPYFCDSSEIDDRKFKNAKKREIVETLSGNWGVYSKFKRIKTRSKNNVGKLSEVYDFNFFVDDILTKVSFNDVYILYELIN